ncbi:MAG TPA: aldo/keto reductase, partial [Atopobiaceae bacterium]|nr:aldo/keto reductase [Atopobiaceae bacterium]
MEYREFQGGRISRLGMGTMRLPRIDGKDGAPIDYARAEEVIDCAYDNGITYFDTAWPYHEGTSEEFVGKALVSRHPRGSFNIATKFHIHANPDYRFVFETQLERLQTDYLDFYLVHAVMDNTIDDYLASGCIDYLMEQRAAGRIRYLGFSSHAAPSNLRRFLAAGDWEFVQIQLNYLDWKYSTAH